MSIGTCIGGLSIDDAYIALAAHTIQSTSGSQITGTLSWTADKVYTELIQGLDARQQKQGSEQDMYVKLWGKISKDIRRLKVQFEQHLDNGGQTKKHGRNG